MRSEDGVYHVLQVPQQEPMAQKSPHSILVLPNRLDARSNIRLGLAGYLFHPTVRNSPFLFTADCAIISADLLAKQYQHRPSHRQRCMHDRLLYRNRPVCRHQAPSLNVFDPTACQDLNLVRAICPVGCEHDKNTD